MKKLPFFCNEGVLNFMKEQNHQSSNFHLFMCDKETENGAPTFQQPEKENLSRTCHHSLA